MEEKYVKSDEPLCNDSFVTVHEMPDEYRDENSELSILDQIDGFLELDRNFDAIERLEEPVKVSLYKMLYCYVFSVMDLCVKSKIVELIIRLHPKEIDVTDVQYKSFMNEEKIRHFYMRYFHWDVPYNEQLSKACEVRNALTHRGGKVYGGLCYEIKKEDVLNLRTLVKDYLRDLNYLMADKFAEIIIHNQK